MGSKTRVSGTEPETTADIEQLNQDHSVSTERPTTDDTIQPEQIFEILSNERRRLVLKYLRQHNGEQVNFRDLVDQIAAWENDTTQGKLNTDDRKCVYTALRQTHLPKLDQFDVIEYDRQRGLIEPKEIIENTYKYMDHIPEREIFWSRSYLFLAVLCGSAALFMWVGIAPLDGLSGSIIVASIAIAFGSLSLAHLYSSYREGSFLNHLK